MPRWEPETRVRLRRHALELFSEYGYDKVSAEMIADRAGVTRRTFFRHFSDKRDVIFAGSERLPPAMTRAIEDAAPELAPQAVVLAALVEVGSRLEGEVDPSRLRDAVVAASPELRERENTKYEDVALALIEGLQRRDIPKATAVLLGRTGATLFRVAFERWTRDPTAGTLATHVHATSTELATFWGA